MANLQQVGIEFVTKGERELANVLTRVDNGQNKLLKTSKALDDAFKRNARIQEGLTRVRRQMAQASKMNVQRQKQEQAAAKATAEAEKKAAQERKRALAEVQRRMAVTAKLNAQRQREERAAAKAVEESARANQEAINSLFGIGRASKSAEQSAKAFGSVIKAMDQDAKMLADANQDNINSILGVDRAHKSARASANAMKQALDEQERASMQSAAANQEVINNLFGIGRASKSAEQSAKAFGDIFKAMDQDAKMADQAMQEYNNALLGVDRAHKSARESANAMKEAFQQQEREAKQLAIAQDEVSASSREAAAASEALQREKDQLKSKYDSVYAASQLYERSLNELERALEVGAVSAAQHRVEVDKLNAEYQQFATGAKIAASSANRFAQQDQRMRGGLNNTNVLLQQAGFQVGDFAVQVQSGTNVLVAFGQQATQIVGTMAALAKSTRMIAIFSGLGIAIPIITAIGQAFMRTREGADELTSELDRLKSVVSSLRNTQNLLSMSTEDLGEKYGEAAKSVREYAQVEAQLRSAISRSEISDSLEDIDDLIEKYGDAKTEIVGFGESLYDPTTQALKLSRNLRQIEKDFGLVGNEAQKLQRAFFGIINAEDFDSQRQAVDVLLSTVDDLSISMSDMPKPVAEMLLQFFEANRQFEEANSIIKAIKEGLKDASEAAEETNKALARQVTHQMQIATIQKEVNAGVEEILATRDAELQKQQDRIRLAQVELEFGKDSKEFRQAQLEIDERIFRQRLAENNILGNNADEIVKAWKEARNLEQATKNTRDAAAEIGPALQSAIDQANAFANAIDRAADRAAGIGISTAAIRAETEALRSGASEPEAAARGAAEQLRQELLRELPSDRIQREVGRQQIEQQVQSRFEEELARQQALAARSELRSSLRGDDAGGGGGGATESQEDYLRQLQQEAELKLRMIGLSEREQRRLEIENELKQKGLPIEEKRIEQVLRAEQALRRAQQAEQRRQDIMNTVSNNIESALMSVVDGTKSVEDAFRGMLRNIILEIYKQQVAQPFAQQAGNFLSNLFFSNGGVFKGGNVTPFANGGVVGGPTYFPMRNGSTGLMGEAGPEAIMPLKRTKGGKLGVVAEGSGSINQTLVFNISANGDESVKRIVRDEAPRIAEQAKSAVVDAKRRGGSYGRAFR